MADPVDLPFDQPLDTEQRASVLSRRLNDARVWLESELSRRHRVMAEVELAGPDPGAAPVSLLTAGDEVEISMGVAGTIHVFGRGDEYAGQNVLGPIQTYVRAVVEGGLREVYWPETFTGPPFRKQSKTRLLVDGKWRRAGAFGVSSRGKKIERHYEPYA